MEAKIPILEMEYPLNPDFLALMEAASFLFLLPKIKRYSGQQDQLLKKSIKKASRTGRLETV
jgi:hypothetical protein